MLARLAVNNLVDEMKLHRLPPPTAGQGLARGPKQNRVLLAGFLTGNPRVLMD